MAIGVGDILRLAVLMTFDADDDIVNVWHILMNDLGTAATDSEVMAGISNALDIWYAQLAGATDPSIDGVSVGGQNLTKAELLPEVPFVFTGTNAGDLLPIQTTPMLSFNSQTPRHGSRIYLPPLVETAASDGVIVAGTMTTLTNMALDLLDELVDPVTTLAFERVAYDRATGTPRPLFSAFIPGTLRTQRRRRQGVGA